MRIETNILITGAGGQLGANIIDYFEKNTNHNIIATDIRLPKYHSTHANEELDVLDKEKLSSLVEQYQVTEIYHLAALLSATGEKNPILAWDINMGGLLNVLECARAFSLKVFWPSSIAVFGETTPKHMTPQRTVMEPSTAYGISKVSGELWCEYYYNNYGVDVRSVRFPGLISWKGDPGGGTTDYAVDIFHQARKSGSFTSFLSEDTYLPMLYMDDAIEGVVKLMSVDANQIKQRDSYNISGLTFSPRELAQEIKKHIPDFSIDYQPDFRQKIAESWPASIEDVEARQDWGWEPKFDLNKMTTDMLAHI